MRETAEAAGAAPRRGIGALLLVALLSLVLAVGLASHHDEVPAPLGAVAAAGEASPGEAIAAALPASPEESLVACSFLLLCAVALLLAAMRTRRPAAAHPGKAPRAGAVARPPLPGAPAFPPSLDVLSISRT